MSLAHPLLAELAALEAQWQVALEAASSLAELDTLRIAYWGKQGRGTLLIGHIGKLSTEDKRAVAPPIQAFSRAAAAALEEKKVFLNNQEIARAAQQLSHFDVSAPAAAPDGPQRGSLHPCTHILRRTDAILQSMGFTPARGPEVETAWYNFEALNIGEHHPARDMQDTLWLREQTTQGHRQLLRTHTSSVQVRTMTAGTPPFAIYAPGRVYRHEATDATHDYVFHQLEILLVDKNISVANLATLLKVFMSHLFQRADLDIRLRPSYFPFVKPGLEVDISCIFCKGGCPTCKRSGWIEIGGAGIVHQDTLAACDIDPHAYQGLAWGLGIERLAMLLYGVNDIRIFHNTPVDVLSQWP